MADDVRIGPDGIESHEPLPAHFCETQREVVFGAGKRVAHVPSLPVDHELVEPLAIPLGIFDMCNAKLLEMARRFGEINAASDAVFRDKHRISGALCRTQFANDAGGVRSAFVRMLVAERVLPLA